MEDLNFFKMLFLLLMGVGSILPNPSHHSLISTACAHSDYSDNAGGGQPGGAAGAEERAAKLLSRVPEGKIAVLSSLSDQLLHPRDMRTLEVVQLSGSASHIAGRDTARMFSWWGMGKYWWDSRGGAIYLS